MSKRTLSERIAEADMYANRYLGDANEALEAGKTAKAEKLETKAQYWLDKLNELEGFNDMGTHQTDEPAAVDMGGDFEGFLEAVNAPKMHPQPEFYVTATLLAADGSEVYARTTKTAEGGYVIEVLRNGILTRESAWDRNKYRAQAIARDMARVFVERINNAIETPAAKPETPRVKQLRANIERLQREIDSVQYELAQELGEV